MFGSKNTKILILHYRKGIHYKLPTAAQPVSYNATCTHKRGMTLPWQSGKASWRKELVSCHLKDEGGGKAERMCECFPGRGKSTCEGLDVGGDTTDSRT